MEKGTNHPSPASGKAGGVDTIRPIDTGFDPTRRLAAQRASREKAVFNTEIRKLIVSPKITARLKETQTMANTQDTASIKMQLEAVESNLEVVKKDMESKGQTPELMGEFAQYTAEKEIWNKRQEEIRKAELKAKVNEIQPEIITDVEDETVGPPSVLPPRTGRTVYDDPTLRALSDNIREVKDEIQKLESATVFGLKEGAKQTSKLNELREELAQYQKEWKDYTTHPADRPVQVEATPDEEPIKKTWRLTGLRKWGRWLITAVGLGAAVYGGERHLDELGKTMETATQGIEDVANPERVQGEETHVAAEAAKAINMLNAAMEKVVSGEKDGRVKQMAKGGENYSGTDYFNDKATFEHFKRSGPGEKITTEVALSAFKRMARFNRQQAETDARRGVDDQAVVDNLMKKFENVL